MLKPSYLGLPIALLFCYQMAHAESTTNKCTDGKKITYANMPCEKLGLRSAGPVRDAVTVVPAPPKPQIIPAEKPAKEPGETEKAPDSDADEIGVPKPAKIKPINPLIQKML